MTSALGPFEIASAMPRVICRVEATSCSWRPPAEHALNANTAGSNHILCIGHCSICKSLKHFPCSDFCSVPAYAGAFPSHTL